MLTCKDVAERIAAREIHEISWVGRMRLRVHLAVCKVCAEFARQIATVDRAATELGRMAEHGDLPGTDLPPDARTRIEARLLAEHQCDGPSTP